VGKFGPIAATLSADGRMLVVANHTDGSPPAEGPPGGRLQLLDPATALPLRDIDESDPPAAVALSPDGRFIALASTDGPVHLWSVRSGRHLFALPGHQGGTHAVGFTPDGRTLLSGGADAVVRLWEVASGGERARFTGHSAPVEALAVSPDGRAFVATTATGQVEVRDLEPWRRARGPVAQTLEEDARRLWHDLASSAGTADRAVARLTASPQAALALLKERLTPAAAPDLGGVPGLVARLDHRRFAVRDSAAGALTKLGPAARPALRRTLEAAGSEQQRRLLHQILDDVAAELADGPELQALRAVEVLERVGSAEAEELLTKLSAGAAEAPRTEAARAALRRLAEERKQPRR
jgi:dipeptidyl aminopeptidase/acylaminoacyl peptidase